MGDATGQVVLCMTSPKLQYLQRVRLINAELEQAVTLSKVAANCSHLFDHTRLRHYLQTARKALDDALTHMFAFNITEAEFGQLTANVERVESMLDAAEKKLRLAEAADA